MLQRENPYHSLRGTKEEMAHIVGLKQRIATLPQPAADFFRLALLRVQQRVSRVAPDGGWFRWVEKPIKARRSPIGSRNRAGYKLPTIFHIELLSLGLDEEEIKKFRYESIRSHVEAMSPPLKISGYRMPDSLREVLSCLPAKADPRIAPMLQGYFEDMYLTLKALYDHLRPDAVCAFVVGNVRHAGVMGAVDQMLGDVAKQAGFICEGNWIARLRGNSAQQMGKFGRQPTRGSVVLLRKC